MITDWVDFNEAGYGMVKIPGDQVSEDERGEIQRYFRDVALYLNREDDGSRVLMYRGWKVAGREYVTDLEALDKQWEQDQSEWCKELGCCQHTRKSRKTRWGKR